MRVVTTSSIAGRGLMKPPKTVLSQNSHSGISPFLVRWEEFALGEGDPKSECECECVIMSLGDRVGDHGTYFIPSKSDGVNSLHSHDAFCYSETTFGFFSNGVNCTFSQLLSGKL